jgi:hypothetical protein
MNVSELIEQLQQLDPSLEVYINGYEGGYDDVEKMEHIEVCRNFYADEWYYGNHEEFNAVRKGPANPFTFDITKGIVLTR